MGIQQAVIVSHLLKARVRARASDRTWACVSVRMSQCEGFSARGGGAFDMRITLEVKNRDDGVNTART